MLSGEGKYCGGCPAFVHLACAPGDTCDVCGQPFQRYERPKPDPMRDAVLPRALRPAKIGGPLTMALLILLGGVLLFIIYYAMGH